MSDVANASGAEEAAAHDELRVIEALRQGDEAAFARLVDQYHASLRRMARLYVSNRAVADEVVQDTWLGVIQSMWAFEGRSSLKTWIFRILINRAKTRAAREGRTVPFAGFGADDVGAPEAGQPGPLLARGPPDRARPLDKPSARFRGLPGASAPWPGGGRAAPERDRHVAA